MTIPLPSVPVVDSTWLVKHLGDEQLIVIDAVMDNIVGIEPRIYSSLSVIPNAIAVNVEQQLCDRHSPQLHAMPTTEQFNALIQHYQISRDAVVVIYDQQGIYSAPRVWLTFKYMGFDNVFVLDGGLPTWLDNELPVVDKYRTSDAFSALPVSAQSSTFGRNIFCASKRSELLIDKQRILTGLQQSDVSLIDVRSHQRFYAQIPEPRAGVRRGHIPGSINIPFTDVLEHGRFKDRDSLLELFDAHIDQQSSAIIYSCGSGITACIVMLASILVGYHNVCLYDGSWAEWGSDHALPINS
ncbi:sulfurtransferase [Thalassotalea ponticola]|uniref:sulfurtransferase n=1 Tax=Thalassotalea ponticola TaxID=1523392 RepID=UPI0025B4931E|nr:sulfurtransferase [Thalassotalea ponticola]MDN3651547.1 sulfurtransferase [Thalassotalea ponticola]